MNNKLSVGEKFRNCNLHFKKAYLNPLKSEKEHIKKDYKQSSKEFIYDINERGYPTFTSEKEEYWFQYRRFHISDYLKEIYTLITDI